VQPLLAGQGNIDDNVIELPAGPYRAASLRWFDPGLEEWSIWWLDARHGGPLEPAMKGRFSDGVGLFHAEDVFEGRPVRVRFTWSGCHSASPRWEQAFSDDGGRNWETNWVMDFVRA
jgi:hypothetical protein